MTPHDRTGPRRSVRRRFLPRLEVLEVRDLLSAWAGYAHDAQHTAVSDVPSQSFDRVAWQTPVDLSPQYNDGELLIHYGSPLVTPANTVIVPLKTGDVGGFAVEGLNGADGSLLWSQATDYQLPPHDWTPSYSPTLTPGNRLYFAGAGGTVYFIDNPDAPGATVTGQLAFFGLDNYLADPGDYNSGVFINTPITADAAGDIYFGFQVTGPTPLGLQSGIARIGADGSGTWVAAAAAAGDPVVSKVVHNSAPALSNDGGTLYVTVSNGDGTGAGSGYLLALDSTTLATTASVTLLDVLYPANPADLNDDGSASPTVGPDGDVYIGVLENPFTSSKGWLLHFSGDLSQEKTPGSFGWDDTVSIVNASLVPSYTGTSPYLLMSKYNNYADLGGDGVNRIAILDPNDTQTDPRTGATVMKEIETIAGLTPDPRFPGLPGAVREWCINTAVVDPFTDSVLANSEDGNLYRWNLATNTFTQVLNLTSGIGEAYTPTLIGVDGTVYAINNATLFAVRAGFSQGSPPGSGAPSGRQGGGGQRPPQSFSVATSSTGSSTPAWAFSDLQPGTDSPSITSTAKLGLIAEPPPPVRDGGLSPGSGEVSSRPRLPANSIAGQSGRRQAPVQASALGNTSFEFQASDDPDHLRVELV